MNGGHYTAFVRFASATDIDFDDIHLTQVRILIEVVCVVSYTSVVIKISCITMTRVICECRLGQRHLGLLAVPFSAHLQESRQIHRDTPQRIRLCLLGLQCYSTDLTTVAFI